ncbi:YebC/PmpR family DNA-binding transcriptional regulator [Candidatus Peregrinibacteria bacterium]|jgi:YebC/PmpR family DNA-binding regulatory protein|nr:YebC/PmpR family DNA-binding transcriptional regulator [Candidatus Peregrinibacteria bacterium]MBT4148591.1 YebC/PmpR family DNA-binding transcriptional regulator [Candidatus Peregrinibacteria bacterium]MBT4365839.1 YebC/PmpR family DNA-binding transcriptional regulator [Candidatus Peregrinibacteria bacterium]
MSGHSKWASIKHKKGAADAKRGKIFTKHAKLITIAAKNGGDPDMNPSLRSAIDGAKSANVPNMNIERAIKKGSGQDKNAVTYEEIYYEGFGPAGTALYVQVLTDNKNRTLSEVKSALTKKGGGMGAAGSVAWMFERKGLIAVPLEEGVDADEVELAAIDAGASDTVREGAALEVHTGATDLARVRDALKDAGIKIEEADITYIPKQTVKIESEEDARKVLGMIELLEENDDVAEVYCNFEMDDELMEKAS